MLGILAACVISMFFIFFPAQQAHAIDDATKKGITDASITLKGTTWPYGNTYSRTNGVVGSSSALSWTPMGGCGWSGGYYHFYGGMALQSYNTGGIGGGVNFQTIDGWINEDCGNGEHLNQSAFGGIKMSLSGNMAKAYNVYYAVHSRSAGNGTMAEVANGAEAKHKGPALDNIAWVLKRKAYRNDLKIRFQNADGTYGEWSEVTSMRQNVGLREQVNAYSRPGDATYMPAAAAGYKAMYYAQTRYVDVQRKSYTASFDGNGGADGGTITRLVGAKLGGLPTSTRESYRFDGWYTEREGGTQVTPETVMGTANVTYYAHWTPLTTVVFHVDDTSTVWKSVTFVTDGTSYEIPDDITEEARKDDCHHTDGTQGFDGWYTDTGYTTPYVTQVLPLGVTHLYGRNWATVTYDNGPASEPDVVYTNEDGGTGLIAAASGTPAAFEKPYGEIAALADQTYRRVTFDGDAQFPTTLRGAIGWCMQPDCADDPVNGLIVYRDTTVYKRWDESYTDGIASIAG